MRTQCRNTSTTYVSRDNESILHEVDPGCNRGDVIEAVGGPQHLVHGVVHHGGRQRVETHKVCYNTTILKYRGHRGIRIGEQDTDYIVYSVPFSMSLDLTSVCIDL